MTTGPCSLSPCSLLPARCLASLWDSKIETAVLRVFMKRSEIPTFKVWSLVDNTPLTCFDFVSDALRRKSWDDMTDEARVVETIDQDTRIIYVRAKGIWPTAGTVPD